MIYIVGDNDMRAGAIGSGSTFHEALKAWASREDEEWRFKEFESLKPTVIEGIELRVAVERKVTHSVIIHTK